MSKKPHRDTIFNRPLSSVKAFEFDQEVVQVFDDMIHRSVPGYSLLLRLIALHADVFVQDRSNIYDLGCSTGIVTRVIDQQTQGLGCNIIAIDNSRSMIERCRQMEQSGRIDWRCEDIEDVEIGQASLVILNLTLQFVEKSRRKSLLEKIYQGLLPGGALVLTEKVEAEESDLQTTITGLYQGFKKIQGYSDLEISNKRSALEQVLQPDLKSLHLQRLNDSGFDPVLEIFHCFNFVSFLAVKNGA
jgi:tRNA (cmo5U34)-methyltransferase